MKLEDILRNIKTTTFILGLFSLLVVFVPGFIFIFSFDQSLFLGIDIFKLIFLSISVSAPFLIFNFSYILLFWSHDLQEEDVLGSFLLAVLLSGIVLFTGLFAHYGLNLGAKTTIIVSIVFDILVLFCVVLEKNLFIKK